MKRKFPPLSCLISLFRSSFSLSVKVVSTKRFTTLSMMGFLTCKLLSSRQIGQLPELTIQLDRQPSQKVFKHRRETAHVYTYTIGSYYMNYKALKFSYTLVMSPLQIEHSRITFKKSVNGCPHFFIRSFMIAKYSASKFFKSVSNLLLFSAFFFCPWKVKEDAYNSCKYKQISKIEQCFSLLLFEQLQHQQASEQHL